MHGKTRWVGLVFALILATMMSGCPCVDENRPSLMQPEGLTVEGAKPVAVGAALQLDTSFAWDPDYRPTQNELQLAEMAKGEMKWTVEPSDGATVSSKGLFKATKPGPYVVTARVPVPSLTASAEVTVTEETETTGTAAETTEETETTSTTVGNTFAGIYKGSWLWTAGQSKADVPWAFTVDDQGKLKGGFDTMLSADTRVVCVLTGQVSDDGKVDASGTADTTVSGAGSNSTPMTLTGQITADGRFAGKLVGSGGKAVEVTATRQ